MKVRHILLMLILLVVGYLCGYKSGKERDEPPAELMTEVEIAEEVDTLSYVASPVQAEKAVGVRECVVSGRRLQGGGFGGEPRTCEVEERDSLVAELPLIQRYYCDSTYEAWVSGPLDAQLDSLRVYAPRTVVTKREWKPPKRWHVGITAGYGYGPGGFGPYLGVGITYSILSF